MSTVRKRDRGPVHERPKACRLLTQNAQRVWSEQGSELWQLVGMRLIAADRQASADQWPSDTGINGPEQRLLSFVNGYLDDKVTRHQTSVKKAALPEEVGF